MFPSSLPQIPMLCSHSDLYSAVGRELATRQRRDGGPAGPACGLWKLWGRGGGSRGFCRGLSHALKDDEWHPRLLPTRCQSCPHPELRQPKPSVPIAKWPLLQMALRLKASGLIQHRSTYLTKKHLLFRVGGCPSIQHLPGAILNTLGSAASG